MDFLDKPTLRPDAVEIADQQHPEHQLGINGRAACMAVERGQLSADRVEVEQPVDLAQEVILRDVILDPKPVK